MQARYIFAAYFAMLWSAYFEKKCRVVLMCLIATYSLLLLLFQWHALHIVSYCCLCRSSTKLHIFQGFHVQSTHCLSTLLVSNTMLECKWTDSHC